MRCGPAVGFQLGVAEVEVEDVAFDRDEAADPYEADDVEAQEARLRGVAVREDGAEGRAVAIEADEDEDCKIFSRSTVWNNGASLLA